MSTTRALKWLRRDRRPFQVQLRTVGGTLDPAPRWSPIRVQGKRAAVQTAERLTRDNRWGGDPIGHPQVVVTDEHGVEYLAVAGDLVPMIPKGTSNP